MVRTLRNIYMGIAYIHFHPDDKKKVALPEKLFKDAWYLGYPRDYFYHKSELTNEIMVEDMTDWELKYIFRE